MGLLIPCLAWPVPRPNWRTGGDGSSRYIYAFVLLSQLYSVLPFSQNSTYITIDFSFFFVITGDHS